MKNRDRRSQYICRKLRFELFIPTIAQILRNTEYNYYSLIERGAIDRNGRLTPLCACDAFFLIMWYAIVLSFSCRERSVNHLFLTSLLAKRQEAAL